MSKRPQYAPMKWLLGIVLLALGLGMLLAILIPFCFPLLSLFCIALGGWLMTKFRQC